MWIPKSEFKKINTALHQPGHAVVDRTVFQMFAAPKSVEKDARTCPACHCPLIHKSLPYVELFVQVCPNDHGVNLSQEVWQKLRVFLHQQWTLIERKKTTLKLIATFAILIPVLALFFSSFNFGAGNLNRLFNRFSQPTLGQQIGPRFWPMRDLSSFPYIPVKESKINDSEELFYFETLLTFFEEGISNRLNIDAALNSHRPAEEYEMVYAYYHTKQLEFLTRLRSLTPPERLQEFHRHLIAATEGQIRFYFDFMEGKIENPNLVLQDLLRHHDLAESSKRLHAAYAAFLKLYPSADTQTDQAIERRLCWLDII